MSSDLYTQAESLYRNREFRKAQLLLKKEVVRPDAALNLRSLYGLILARSDRSFYGFYRGLKWCSEAVKQRPEDPILLVHLGMVYLYHGLRVQALVYLDRAFEMAPEISAVREARGLLGFRQRPKIPFLPRKNPLNIFLGKTAVWLKKVFSRNFTS